MVSTEAVPAVVDGLRPALAFPGQGIPLVDLAQTLHLHDDDLLDTLAEMIGTRDWDRIDLADTRIAQPAIFTASLLSARSRLSPDAVHVVLGHSLGEISALAFAGVLAEEVALQLVHLRGELCAGSASRSGKMVAIMNLEQDALEWVRRSAIAATGGVLEVAAVNGRSQVVLSGDPDTVDAAISACGDLGGIGAVLPIGGGFHSPLMYPVVAGLRDALAGVKFSPPRVPVLSTVDCRLRSANIAEERELLARSLVLPVRWHDAVKVVQALGVDRAVDAGPGQTLQKLGRRGGGLRFVHISEVDAA